MSTDTKATRKGVRDLIVYEIGRAQRGAGAKADALMQRLEESGALRDWARTLDPDPEDTTDPEPSTDYEHPAPAHLYLEARGLGPYEARVDLSEGGNRLDAVHRYYTLTVSELEGLRLQVTNALDALRHRQWSDAVCGDCAECKNTRMVDTQRHGSRWSEHCPTCSPKIMAASALLRTGLPDHFDQEAPDGD